MNMKRFGLLLFFLAFPAFALASPATITLSVSGVTAADKIYDGTTDATVDVTNAVIADPGDIPSGDTVTLDTSGAAGSFADKNAGDSKTVFVSGLALSVASPSGNEYVLDLVNADNTATIEPLHIHVSAVPFTKEYDGSTNISALSVFTLNDAAPGDVAHFTEHYASAEAGTGKVIFPGGYIDDGNKFGLNYILNFFENDDGIITPAPVTVSIEAPSQTYDGTPKAASITTDPAGTPTSVTYDGSTIVPTDAGTYAVDAVADDGNYAGSASGTLVILKADQGISFGALSDKVLGDDDFDIAASASSTLAVAFSSEAPAVCSVSSATVRVSGTGVCAIKASQAGDSNHNAAADVERSFSILPRRASIGGGGGGFVAQAAPVAPATPAAPSQPQGQVLGAATYDFENNLKLGSSGADVIALQQFLIDGGYLHIDAPSGYFGQMTMTAVKAFQTANALPQTGFVGPLTRAILNEGQEGGSVLGASTKRLTTAQIESLVILLQSFGADASAIARVRHALAGN